MCGICGFHSGDGGPPPDPAVLGRMADALAHRGPDDAGSYVGEHCLLASRRLSIIDLVSGHQPIANEDESIWVVYNGEIYNYRELRGQLVNRGHRFTTNSDTEVIVHAYEEYGPACLQQFNGMFAFALWDERERLLFLARDRLGIKPLYYYHDQERLLFASEIKSILADPTVPRRVDHKGLSNFFTFGHAVAPDTIYQGIKKLLPGHYLTCGDGEVKIVEYWDVAPRPDPEPDEDELAGRVYELLGDSVRRRLISDVPLGAFLSGGIDSSTIVGLMTAAMEQPVKTFSVGFDIGGSAYSELDDARLVARHFATDHHELRLTSSDLVEALQKLVYHYDEPFGDAACIPTYLVSRLACQKVKVALTGEGSDELFGGYRRYVAEQLSPLYQMLPLFLRDGLISRLVNGLPRFRRLKKAVQAMGVADPDARYGYWLEIFSDEMKKGLFVEPVLERLERYDPFAVYRHYYRRGGTIDSLNRLMYTDLKTWLADTYLEKTDKASMAASLEARVPFLDHRLVELAASIPSRYKIRGPATKLILKRAVRELLPERVLRKRKHGFAVPTDPWFQGELKEFVRDILLDERTRRRGYFNPDYLERLFSLHESGRQVLDTHLWLLLNFELWQRTFMDAGGSL